MAVCWLVERDVDERPIPSSEDGVFLGTIACMCLLLPRVGSLFALRELR